MNRGCWAGGARRHGAGVCLCVGGRVVEAGAVRMHERFAECAASVVCGGGRDGDTVADGGNGGDPLVSGVGESAVLWSLLLVLGALVCVGGGRGSVRGRSHGSLPCVHDRHACTPSARVQTRERGRLCLPRVRARLCIPRRAKSGLAP